MNGSKMTLWATSIIWVPVIVIFFSPVTMLLWLLALFRTSYRDPQDWF